MAIALLRRSCTNIATAVLGFVLLTGPIDAGPSPDSTAGIYQLIETLNGRDHCIGVVIQLSKLRFPATLASEHIKLTEAKHNQDVTNSITWQVDASRRKLTIRFRPGRGDFGTGNRVSVRIDQTILEGASDRGHVLWVIGTDPL